MKKLAFTLVELIVWITISMILMLWVGIFVGGWISNLTLQQKVLDNTSDFRFFSEELYNTFFRIDTYYTSPIFTNSWILLKQNKEFDKWWFTYIWIENLSWSYCDSDSDFWNTNHIFIKNFIPFEEKNENIFSDFWDILTATDNWYTSYQFEHVVKDSSDNIVVWKWVFWDKFEDWLSWTWVYLNSPTGLAYDSTNNVLFISDSLNNRVLAYDTWNGEIYKLLDERDWLLEPTWLYYNDTQKALYIANSWKGEILKYNSKQESSNSDLTLSWVTQNNVNKVEIEFLTWTINLTNPDSKDDFNFSSISEWVNNVVKINWNKLKYYFVNNLNPESSQADCISWNEWNYVVNSSDVPILCSATETWTWQLVNLKNVDFNDEKIIVSDILPLLSNTWSYYVNLKLYNWNNELYNNYFPYFTNWDDDLFTKGDNTLEVYKSWLAYPSWIWISWTIRYNEFLDLWYDDLNFDKNYDYKLETPVSSLDIDYTDNLLNLDLKYYKQYNCYDEGQRVERNFILKKSFK